MLNLPVNTLLNCAANVTDSRRAVWQNSIWHGKVYEAKGYNWISPCRKHCTQWHILMLSEHSWKPNRGLLAQQGYSVKCTVVHFSSRLEPMQEWKYSSLELYRYQWWDMVLSLWGGIKMTIDEAVTCEFLIKWKAQNAALNR